MRIVMTTSVAADIDGVPTSLAPNHEYDLPDELAAHYVKVNFARPADEFGHGAPSPVGTRTRRKPAANRSTKDTQPSEDKAAPDAP